MKVKKLIKALKQCGDERIPIVVIDKKGREFSLEWNCIDDGPDWAQLSFVVSDRGWPTLDSDMAKAILDYAAQDPYNRKISLFGMDERIEEYALRVTWPIGRNRKGHGWCSQGVKKIAFEETKEGRKMVLKVNELPPWKDEDYDQEEADKAMIETEKKVEECMACITGKADIVPQTEIKEE